MSSLTRYNLIEIYYEELPCIVLLLLITCMSPQSHTEYPYICMKKTKQTKKHTCAHTFKFEDAKWCPLYLVS